MAKRAQTCPEDLYRGCVVYYGRNDRGIVTDAFGPVDEFWVTDEKTTQPVRDENGAKRSFRAEELRIATRDDRAARPQSVGVSDGASCARVLVIGTEPQMLRILERFGTPDVERRQETQMVLALPCNFCICGPSCEDFDATRQQMCGMGCHVQSAASEGMEQGVLELARRLRPDIPIGIRPYHLKQAYEAAGPGLRKLSDYYCLSAVTLPYGTDDIAASSSKYERTLRTQVRCQIDLGVSAEGFPEAGDASLLDAVRRSLREHVGITISDGIWSDETQLNLRRKLGIDMPLMIWDGSEVKVFLLLLPDNAKCSQIDEELSFEEATASAKRGDVVEATDEFHKTVAEWRKEQDQFQDEPGLPEGWIRVKSKTGQTYFWNTRKKESTFEFPLPAGWTRQVSKSSGKPYYFNVKKRKSSFDVPTEE
ncbi:unnamed protein product [Polarella glacialis]|uniref:WW domain-containing protein n=1 Tax=Polarella glacialis TaxID=89957 RepID=A0A813JBF8_POLGL|nr:unnamed protein product [Polarella glacialis]